EASPRSRPGLGSGVGRSLRRRVGRVRGDARRERVQEPDGTIRRRPRRQARARPGLAGSGLQLRDETPAELIPPRLGADRRQLFFAVARPPLRPAAFFCAVAPPCFELLLYELPE